MTLQLGKNITTRVSCAEGDPGYAAWEENGALHSEWRIEVDGKRVSRVVTADPEHGFVFHYLEDENGETHLDETGEAAASETLFGKVTVRAELRR